MTTYRLVPVEASEEIKRALATKIKAYCPEAPSYDMAHDLYETMLSAAPEPPPAHSTWRDMASAPKDGSDILVYDPDLEKDDRVQIAFWNDILNYWQPLNDNSADPQPTCWMYKPSPPTSAPVPSKQSELLEAAIQALWHLGSDADRITLADNHKWKTSQDEAAALLRTAIRNYEQGGGG